MKTIKNYQHKYFVLLIFYNLTTTLNAFNIIELNKQLLYEYVGTVQVGAKAPQGEELPAPPNSGWIVRGKLSLQRQSNQTLAAYLAVDDVTLNNRGEKFLKNKDMYPAYKPFRIELKPDGSISHLRFKETDPIWSTNFKRAIAALFQFQTEKKGAFVIEEMGIHGLCSTEYFISNKTNYISIRKTPELSTCKPYAESIHVIHSNMASNTCKFDFQQNVISGNEAIYGMLPHPKTGYFLSMAHVKGSSLIHTFESTGEAQYINSELLLNFLNETDIENPIDIETSMSEEKSSLELLQVPLNDPTGGRYPQKQEALISEASRLLTNLVKGLFDTDNIKFSEPYDTTVSEIIKLLTQMEYETLKKMYSQVAFGTSYQQETIRNIFYDILPRIGTKAAVFLTRYMVVEKEIKNTIAVQLLISMPFHIFELSQDLVKECEVFLTLSPDRPDVRQAAILSFATLVYNVYTAKGITDKVFEGYVQQYFNFYLNSRDYESKMLYLQALSNLQVGNVANYLDPLVSNPEESDDIKFLAAWTTLSVTQDRAEQIYEIYWPIFESRNSSLELRVAALTLLLISNPTAARLISIHRIIQSETDPHMINYYRTTITSISETTYPCYQYLRRLLSYMHRHLPQKPEKRYWVTGNYIVDYRDSKFGIGAMTQLLLVGDPKSDLPVVAYIQFDTEALGKFTGQRALYIKARGLPDALFKTYMKANSDSDKFLRIQTLLELLDAPLVNTKEMHLELIFKMESKTILSFYINEKTFQKFTYRDAIDRIKYLIQADTHINMQMVRWPFMTKYVVPTVLGTTADVLLQNTVLTSIRGNIKRNHHSDIITTAKTTLDIDVFYTSYSSCSSHSYNPFLNLNHEINREQGLLIYAPLNLSLNYYDEGCLELSFSRRENLTTGLSFKSRSVTTTKGVITKLAEPFEEEFIEIMYPEKHGNHEEYSPFKYDFEDLGFSVAINTDLNELNKHRGMLLKSEFIENGFSRNMIIHFVMYIFSMAQLSSIHLGHDRNFTVLISNKEPTQIERFICITNKPVDDEHTLHHINFTLKHSNDYMNLTDGLHKWTVNVDVLSTRNDNWINMAGNVERIATNVITSLKTKWMACFNVTYNSLVLTKQPHTLTGYVIFGNTSIDSEDCSKNGSSSIYFSGKASPSKKAEEFLLSDNQLTDTDYCPKEVLKFSPIPTSKYCKRSNFENFTIITNYEMDLKFNAMPAGFDYWSTRLDHFVSSFSPTKVDRLNMSDRIYMALKVPRENFWLTIDINGIKKRIYHIPFLQKLDSKYDMSYELAYDFGVKRSCSVINGMVNSFNDYLIDLNNYHKVHRADNCLTLLAADCSALHEMAIFFNPFKNNQLSLAYHIQVYIGENYITFTPSSSSSSMSTLLPLNQTENQLNDRMEEPNSTEDPIYIILNGETDKPIDIRKKPFQYPTNQNDTKNYDFRVEVNEHNILLIENKLTPSLIQFDMKNILNFEIYSVYKSRMCGLCSKPLNSLRNYTLCGI